MDHDTKEPNNQNDNLPAVPKEWPGAFGLYKYSKQAVMVNIWAIVAIIAINFALALAPGDRRGLQILSNLVGMYFGLANLFLLLAGSNGKKLSLEDALRKAANPMLLLQFIAVSLVIYFGVALGFLLLIVPGILILPRLVLAPYYLIDRNLSIGDALSTAWHESKGITGPVWGIIGVYILMGLLALTIIGAPFSIYLIFMYSASLTILYQYVTKQAPAVTAVNPKPTKPATKP